MNAPNHGGELQEGFSHILGSGSENAVIFCFGDLRMVMQHHSNGHIIYPQVILALTWKMLEYAQRGRAVAWEGLLMAASDELPFDSGPFSLNLIAVGTALMWAGWRDVQQ